MTMTNNEMTDEEFQTGVLQLDDFIVAAVSLIRDGWTIKDLQKELITFCTEEEQVCEMLSDSQRDVLNNNPDATYLVKKNKKGKVIDVVTATPLAEGKHLIEATA